jgi:hypothetical protein
MPVITEFGSYKVIQICRVNLKNDGRDSDEKNSNCYLESEGHDIEKIRNMFVRKKCHTL